MFNKIYTFPPRYIVELYRALCQILISNEHYFCLDKFLFSFFFFFSVVFCFSRFCLFSGGVSRHNSRRRQRHRPQKNIIPFFFGRPFFGRPFLGGLFWAAFFGRLFLGGLFWAAFFWAAFFWAAFFWAAFFFCGRCRWRRRLLWRLTPPRQADGNGRDCLTASGTAHAGRQTRKSPLSWQTERASMACFFPLADHSPPQKEIIYTRDDTKVYRKVHLWK